MNLNNIVTLIKNVGLNYPTIQEFGEGDIYEFLNSKEHKYPCVFLTIESISTDGDVQNINATLFYVDRLLDDNSNKLDIQSVSMIALKSIIEKLEETNYINFTSINYTPFTEKFTDLCAGSFAQCTIQVNDILECDDYEFGTLTITENGLYDILGYSQVIVDVKGGSDPVLESLDVTENGTYTPEEGVDGFNLVTVNVEGGGGITSASNVIFEDGENAEVKVSRKTEKVRVDIVPDGSTYKFMFGTQELNFADLNNMLQNTPDFVVFVHDNREHRCVRIELDSTAKFMEFTSPIIEGVNTKAQSFLVTSIDGTQISNVKRTDIINENKSDADNVRARLNNIDKTINDILYTTVQKESDETLSGTVINDKVLGGDGKTQKTAAGFVIQKINVSDENIKSVHIIGRQGSTNTLICFHDINGNVVGAIQKGTTGIISEYTKEKPENAVEVWVSYSTAYTYYVGIFKDETIDINEATDIKIKEALEISPAPLSKLKDVNLILIYGQSLSIGADTVSPISTSAKYSNLYKLGNAVVHSQQSKATLSSLKFEPLTEKSVETPASGCAEKIMELIQSEYGISAYSKYWDNHKFVFASCGRGSTSINLLLDSSTETSLLSGLYNVIDRVKEICDENNWTLNIPAFVWIQGETDQKGAMTHDDYKSKLEQLRSLIDTKAKAVTSQTNDVKCVCYQTCASNTVFGTGISGNNTLALTHNNALAKMAVPMAQMELVRDSELFSAAAPTYCIDHNMNDISAVPANIHLTNVGSKMEGAIAGIALTRILANDNENNGVVPKTYKVDGNSIIITYEVNVPPLRINTEFVKEVEHYGFKVINTNDNDIVSNVSVFDREITIECSESPIGAIAIYGYNGVDGYDGRINGGRGNICDSAGYIYNAKIGKFHYVLNNYAYCFAFTVASGTDNPISL